MKITICVIIATVILTSFLFANNSIKDSQEKYAKQLANTSLYRRRDAFKKQLAEYNAGLAADKKARIDAEKQTLEIDFEPYKSIELISASLSSLKEKLEKT